MSQLDYPIARSKGVEIKRSTAVAGLAWLLLVTRCSGGVSETAADEACRSEGLLVGRERDRLWHGSPSNYADTSVLNSFREGNGRAIRTLLSVLVYQGNGTVIARDQDVAGAER